MPDGTCDRCATAEAERDRLHARMVEARQERDAALAGVAKYDIDIRNAIFWHDKLVKARLTRSGTPKAALDGMTALKAKYLSPLRASDG